MEQNAQAIRALVQNVSDRRARWKPDPDAWSMVDVVNHLVYEEEHDFRDRLDLILHRPEEPWPSGDSARGVTDNSRRRSLEEALEAFLTARAESLAWLESLNGPQWETCYEAPFGEIKAGDVLAAWVAHDLLHIRQLVELRWQHLTEDVEPYRLRYAGTW
jgi:hypothetical protein